MRTAPSALIWIPIAGICSLPLFAAVHPAPRVTAIRAGRILTMAGEPIQGGTIIIRGGKIQSLGPGIAIPAGATVVDASTQVVMPGLIAAHSSLAESSAVEENLAPHIRAADSFDYYKDYSHLVEAGVTSAFVAPGGNRLLGGQGGVIKLAGASPAARTIRNHGDFRVTLGESAESPPALFRPPLPPTTDDPILPAQRQLGGSLASQVALLRQVLSDSTGVSGDARGGLGIISKELSEGGSFRIRANRVPEIVAAMNLARRHGLRLTLEGVAEGYLAANKIAESRSPVVVISPLRLGTSTDLDLTRETAHGRFSRRNLRALIDAGVIAALAPPADYDLPNLLVFAAAEVSQGVSPDAALRTVTSNAAVALGVSSRVGSLRPGLDADLVFVNGHPLDSNSRVEAAMINGEFAFRRKPADSGATIAVKAGRILTATQGEIRNGAVIIRAGKIVEVNRTGFTPPGAKVIDASTGVVMPGMIDSHSHLGLHADSAAPPIQPSALTGTASARTSLVKGLTPGDPAFSGALREGVTTVLLAPTTSGTVSGRASLIKTAECSGHGALCRERLLRETAALCFNMSAASPRMAQPWTFKEQLQRAKDYLQRRSRYEQELKDWNRDRKEAENAGKPVPREPAEVAEDQDLEPFAALFAKQIPALVHAGRSDEITNALKVFCDESALPVVLVGAGDGFRIPDEIRRRGASVALGPQSIRQVGGARVNMGQKLSEAGISTLFQSSSPSGAELLRLNAALAVRGGMNPHDALQALTITPARALMVADRIGSIEVGKDADLVILSGDPWQVSSRIRKVLVNGKVAYNGN